MYPPMASIELDDIDELALCSCCQRAFNDTERAPKLLECKHHFCLTCTRGVLRGAQDVQCAHCWQRTKLPPGGADALPTHAAVQALARRLMPEPACDAHGLPVMWCETCGASACRECDHSQHAHSLRPARELRANLQREARMLFGNLQRLAVRQRDFLLNVLDAATELEVLVERELAAPAAVLTPPERALLEMDDNSLNGSPAGVAAEYDKLRGRHTEALLQSRLDDLIRNAKVPLDFELIRQALAGPSVGESPPSPSPATEPHDPDLFLANYCMGLLYTRNCFAQHGQLFDVAVNMAATLEQDVLPEKVCETAPSSPGGTTVTSVSTVGLPLQRNPTVYPLFYFNLEFNGSPFGRVVIEVRDDVAPRMAQNFSGLSTGELGIGYRGCHVFQCWEYESLITGDFKLNNGRVEYSIFKENYLLPDDTKMVAVRDAMGMRRSQKRHDNHRLVGSQFRIMLREMGGFTAILAYVVEGLELVEHLSRTGDSTGKPHSTIVIANCGKLN